MMKQRRIAIAYDRSEESEQALLWCIKKFATREDLLVLIHIVKLSEVDEDIQEVTSANELDACMPCKVKSEHPSHSLTFGSRSVADGKSQQAGSQVGGTAWRRFEGAMRVCDEHDISYTVSEPRHLRAERELMAGRRCLRGARWEQRWSRPSMLKIATLRVCADYFSSSASSSEIQDIVMSAYRVHCLDR
eukprot:745995-Hanusia_phi.AAC.6